MRKEERIDEFLKRFGDCWRKVPDWRFGQLVMNIFGSMASSGRDPFFPEEDEMITFIENYFNEPGNTPY